MAESGGTKLAQLFAEIDLDRTKYDKALDDAIAGAEVATIDIEKAFKALGTKTDATWEKQRLSIEKYYKAIVEKGGLTANEIVAIEQGRAAKIAAIDAKQYVGRNKYLADEASAYAENAARILTIQQASVREQTEQLAQMNAARERYNQVNAQSWMTRIAAEKRYLNAEAEAFAENERRKRTIQNNSEKEQLAQMQAFNVARETYNQQRAQEKANLIIGSGTASGTNNSDWSNLGIRSTAAIKAQEEQIKASAAVIQSTVQRGSQDWINIENAKNAKLKSLNAEMVDEHSMSMASMTRAVLRFYAAWYVVSAGFMGIKNLIMGGVEAIDSLKVSTIAVAALITNMQGPKNVVANFKDNLVYAKALNEKMMEIDVNSFANYEQIQLMNRAMVGQGVILDINKAKQVEAFTALTNTVAMLTTGQDKNKQASQEIRALMTGQIRQGDMVSMQINDLIKKQGIYKGGLKELVEEGKKHGDTLERLMPYMIGVAAASGEISKTWEAVGTSIQTAWGILQRVIFADFYKSLVTNGQSAVAWVKANADTIAKTVKIAFDVITDAIKIAIAVMGLFAAATIAAMIKAGDATAWFALRWEVMTQRVTLATNKMTLGWGIFTALLIGWEAGKYLSDQFEIVRLAGIAMVYSILDAWAFMMKEIKIGWEYMKLVKDVAAHPIKSALDIDNYRTNATKQTQTNIAAIKAQAAEEKRVRDQIEKEQIRDNLDVNKAVKAKAKVPVPVVLPGKDPNTEAMAKSSKDQSEILNNRKKEIKAIYDEQIEMAEHAAKMAERNGQYEITTINNLYDAKETALNNYLQEQYKVAREEVALEAKKVAEENAKSAAAAAKSTTGKVASFKTYDSSGVLYEKMKAIYADYSKTFNKFEDDKEQKTFDAIQKQVTTTAEMYNIIDKYSEESHLAQMKTWDTEMLKYMKDGATKEQIGALLAEKERVWQQDKLTAAISFYDSIQGYEEQAIALKLKNIEIEKDKYIALYHDEIAAEKLAAQERAKLIGTVVDGWKSYWNEYIKDAKNAYNIGKQLAQSTAQAMQNAFSTYFFDVIEGRFNTAGDILKSFSHSINQALANAAGQYVTGKIAAIFNLGGSDKQNVQTMNVQTMNVAGNPLTNTTGVVGDIAAKEQDKAQSGFLTTVGSGLDSLLAKYTGFQGTLFRDLGIQMTGLFTQFTGWISSLFSGSGATSYNYSAGTGGLWGLAGNLLAGNWVGAANSAGNLNGSDSLQSNYDNATFGGGGSSNYTSDYNTSLMNNTYDSSYGSGGGSTFGDYSYGTIENAYGNAFNGGSVTPFSQGASFTNGIYNSPHFFPMANGGTGLMGEAGPEAVIPLKRTKDGKLGIGSSNGEGKSLTISNQITINANGKISPSEISGLNSEIKDVCDRWARSRI